MTRKGVWMVCLAAASVGGLQGCWTSASVPPSASMPAPPPSITTQPAPAPLITDRPIVGELFPVEPEGPQLTVNRWEPQVPAREWEFIVLHHTASTAGSVDSIHEAHLKKKDNNGNPWLGIGYHFVIGNGKGMGDGEIEPTFRWREQLQGAHAGQNDYNQRGIGICLVGNFENDPPSVAQLDAVRELVSIMKDEYGITSDRVVGHGDVKATACPGKLFPLDEVRSSSLASRQVPHDRQSVQLVRLQEKQP